MRKLKQNEVEILGKIEEVIDENVTALVEELCNLLVEPQQAWVFYRAIDRLKRRDVSTTAMEIIIGLFDLVFADIPTELYLFNEKKWVRIEFIEAFLDEFDYAMSLIQEDWDE